MRPVVVFLGAAWLPLSALTQPLPLNIACLSEAEKAEFKMKAQAITSDVTVRLAGLSSSELRAAGEDRQAKLSAMEACIDAARKQGAFPGDVCAKEMAGFAAASTTFERLSAANGAARQSARAEEARRLDALRAAYPAC